MNSNIFIGLIAIVFGIFTLSMRLKGKTEKMSKLEGMRKLFGDKAANIIHLLGYSILPIFLGLALIIFSLIATT